MLFYKTFYDGSLPLVIDNTLIRLDDDRLKRVCEYLNEESELRQIILMTSDRRVLEFSAIKRTSYSWRDDECTNEFFSS